MDEVEKLFSEYVSAHRAGGVDPNPFLDRARDGDREQLALLIDVYLQRAPGREWDAGAFRESGAQAASEPLARALTGRSGSWPLLLPRLRDSASLNRNAVVERLADRLGAGPEREKVGQYYHDMEWGRLDSKGVSDTVLESLAAIVGSTLEDLRKAGRRLGGAIAPSGQAGEVFTRQVHADGDVVGPDAAGRQPGPVGQSSPPLEAPTRIDRLFTGGPDA